MINKETGTIEEQKVEKEGAENTAIEDLIA